MYKLAIETTQILLNPVTIRTHHTWRLHLIIYSHIFLSGLQTKTFYAFLNSLLLASVISVALLFGPLYLASMKF